MKTIAKHIASSVVIGGADGSVCLARLRAIFSPRLGHGAESCFETLLQARQRVGRTPWSAIGVKISRAGHKILETQSTPPTLGSRGRGKGPGILTPMPWSARVPLDPFFAHHTGKPARGPAADQGVRPTLDALHSKSALLCLLAICSLTLPAHAQQGAKKAFLFHGRVEQVNAAAKQLTVHNEPVEGWMGEMTMAFAVDNAAVFDRVKVGDRITAKVYEGDFVLHDVQVVPPGNAATAQVAAGAPGPGIRLEDLERMAVANNPTVAQAQASLRVAGGIAKQAGIYPNPTVGYYGDEIRGGYNNGGKQGGFVSQTIVLGGKLGAARRVAELEASEVQTGGEIQRLRILNDVRASFYRVLAAQRLVEVRQNLGKLAADAAQTSHQLGNIGQADRPDILQAEVEQHQASVSVKMAQQNLQTCWRMLAALMGKPDLAVTRLEGDLEAVPDLNYEEWVATALRESPEVKLAQQAAERAEAALAQAKKAPIPDLQVTGILAQNYEPLDMRKTTGLQGGAQIGIELPIFNRNQGNIAAAKGQVENARQEANRVKLQLQRDLASMFQNYDSARATVEEYKKEMLPRAEQAYKLYQANYQAMAGAYQPVLISQRTLFQLQADYVQALETVWQSALAIRGFLLTNGLSGPIGGPMVGSMRGGLSSPHPAVIQ
jgi:outer membrane protein, heavy metal efflux system